MDGMPFDLVALRLGSGSPPAFFADRQLVLRNKRYFSFQFRVNFCRTRHEVFPTLIRIQNKG